MIKREFEETYNERIFEKRGLRSYFHNSRFRWFKTTVDDLGLQSDHIFELGCFDGRLLQHLAFRPTDYVGFDADWEGGLSDAKSRFCEPGVVFEKSESPNDLKMLSTERFDISVAMETLEHLPPDLVDEYIAEISRVTRRHFIVTVPNEKGIVFFCKHLIKRFLLEGTQSYTYPEFFNATLGRMHKIRQDDHKGFDYDQLILQLSQHFEIIRVEAIPFTRLPRWTGFTIGIVAKKRDKS